MINQFNGIRNVNCFQFVAGGESKIANNLNGTWNNDLF